MDANFESHEVFTRAFSSLYGIHPLKYRKNRKEICLVGMNFYRKLIKSKINIILLEHAPYSFCRLSHKKRTNPESLIPFSHIMQSTGLEPVPS